VNTSEIFRSRFRFVRKPSISKINTCQERDGHMSTNKKAKLDQTLHLFALLICNRKLTWAPKLISIYLIHDRLAVTLRGRPQRNYNVEVTLAMFRIAFDCSGAFNIISKV
jgi:hypothetical protein